MRAMELSVRLVESKVLEPFGNHWKPEVLLKAQKELFYIPWMLGKRPDSKVWTFCWAYCPLCGLMARIPWADDRVTWKFNGNFDAPTFTPSIFIQGGHFSCGFHATVTNGRISSIGTPLHGPKGGE